MFHVCSGSSTPRLYVTRESLVVREPVLSSTHCDTMEDKESEGRAMQTVQALVHAWPWHSAAHWQITTCKHMRMRHNYVGGYQ